MTSSSWSARLGNPSFMIGEEGSAGERWVAAWPATWHHEAMSSRTEWTVEPPEQGWFGRIIAPRVGGRPSAVALGFGVLAAAAFVASLALDWQTVTVGPSEGASAPSSGTLHFTAGVGTMQTLSLAYVFGTVAMLSLVAGLANRPQLAMRLRMATVGAGVGILAVLVALTLRMPRALIGALALDDAVNNGISRDFQDRVSSTYQPGILFGYAAVILALSGVWLAGRPATADPVDPDVDVDAGEEEAESESVQAPAAGRRVSRPDGPLDLSVTADGPIDVTLRGDHAWPR